MRKSLLLLLSLLCLVAKAQSVIVPTNIYFADQHLIVNEGAQKEIQRMVDALHKYPKYFQLKVDVANIYFPVIERIFREEGLPDDFKYLALQESGLNSEAVSTSNAVGFWQFKKEAAGDYGLRINQDVDERKHIIESTRSAARYLIKSNNLYYKNWHNTILSYNLGFTGAKSYAKTEDVNKKEMEITEKTHPYILTLLAHKVAYESSVNKNPAPAVMLAEIKASGKNLSDIALENQLDIAELQKYNKWVANNYIPSDKLYTVIVPVTNPDQQAVFASQQVGNAPATASATLPETNKRTGRVAKREFRKQNGLKVIIARKGDTKEKLASAADLSTRKFLAYNDMYSFDPIVEGEAYYIERKKNKAESQYHVVKKGEQVHQIAQKHGMKVKFVMWYNRMKQNETLAEGRLLWLQHRRPNHTPIEYQKTYPEVEPVQAPANPVVLSQNEVLDEVKTKKATAGTRLPANKNKTDKVSDLQKEAVITEAFNGTESDDDDVFLTESAPVDAALAQTNGAGNQTEQVLTANIDTQVEQINQQEELILYRKRTKAAPVKTEESVFANANPVVLKDAAPGAKKEAIKTAAVTKEPAGPSASAPVSKEQPGAMAPVANQNSGVHVVSQGETLFSISRKYSITVENLKAWNNIGGTPLAIGQHLQVSGPVSTPKVAATPITNEAPALKPAKQVVASIASGTVTTHTVATGETMYQISRRYGVTIKEIMDWNNKVDFNVKPGERLEIKVISESRN